jgi:hypothetical protein
MYNVQKQGIYFLLVGLFKKTPKKQKQNKIYSKINIDKGYLPSSIYVDRGGNIGKGSNFSSHK